MNCGDARRLLDVSLDDALAQPDRDALSAHLAGCDACRREADELERAVGALRGAAPGRAAPAEVGAVLAAVDAASGGSTGSAAGGAATPPTAAPGDADERLAYRRALHAAAAAGSAERRRAAAWWGPLLGAAAALVVAWLLGWLVPGGRVVTDGPRIADGGAPAAPRVADVELPVARDTGPPRVVDADPPAVREAVREVDPARVVDGGPPVARDPAPTAPDDRDDARLADAGPPRGPASVERAPVVVRRPLVAVDTAPLARLGGRVWDDASARAGEALALLREQLRAARAPGEPAEEPRADTPAPPTPVEAPTPLVASTASTSADEAPAPAAAIPAPAPRPDAGPRPGSVDVLHDGDTVRLRVAGTVREVVPTLLTLLEQADDDVAAVARARLEAYRDELDARPDVGPALEEALAGERPTTSWWSGLFASRDEAADPAADADRRDLDRWSRWWAAAEPLLPPDPTEGAA